ncbi:MAG: hypothetical protein HQL50_11825 [Magnetococcales bacterium]|nr:hypothetical protein [Magnetococcales bacterium]
MERSTRNRHTLPLWIIPLGILILLADDTLAHGLSTHTQDHSLSSTITVRLTLNETRFSTSRLGTKRSLHSLFKKQHPGINRNHYILEKVKVTADSTLQRNNPGKLQLHIGFKKSAFHPLPAVETEQIYLHEGEIIRSTITLDNPSSNARGKWSLVSYGPVRIQTADLILRSKTVRKQPGVHTRTHSYSITRPFATSSFETQYGQSSMRVTTFQPIMTTRTITVTSPKRGSHHHHKHVNSQLLNTRHALKHGSSTLNHHHHGLNPGQTVIDHHRGTTTHSHIINGVIQQHSHNRSKARRAVITTDTLTRGDYSYGILKSDGGIRIILR